MYELKNMYSRISAEVGTHERKWGPMSTFRLEFIAVPESRDLGRTIFLCKSTAGCSGNMYDKRWRQSR